MKQIVDMSMRLSAHFTLGEMCYSDTAANHKPKPIPNIPLKLHITALQNLVDRCLEPMRMALKLPIQVNSGYRCQHVNTLVHGVPTSQHMKGEAADLTILLLMYAKQYADYDQLILEHYKKGDKEVWWLHISCRIDYRKNRHEIKEIIKK